jgi:hypothetical protein
MSHAVAGAIDDRVTEVVPKIYEVRAAGAAYLYHCGPRGKMRTNLLSHRW